ncbi:RNA cytosine-C(5)-methyltransferase NSUN2 isoform X3 [Ricinus communis]|uniref:RNA cytosine-C(5)-methyltransferase NSUN2 isoform X1 n=1 Tax=Ricinus communis TaxID=3988 RepID=UPI00201AFF75|nr:RNA cytosine-C(5)-methyltransferase NSUN2 isoform X1 [Ricinus communis]XP_048232397.1 RNA cytosine-C(5)-methyltransferase NSUN2 isoform X2 [Ricinus communis]XP_048232398.1 RNA cytosine-C(5)-methyltransferase NSUN2 isoform X3 [Ricinus communis]
MGGGRGRGNRSRTQRKHFRDGRENIWKRPKSDSSDPTNTTDNPTWQPFATQNLAFDEYYKEQGIVATEEWDTFVEVLRKPLPAAFRINSSSQFCTDIRLQLENDFMRSLQAEVADGGEVDAIRPLPWYPDNLAWHSNFSRMQLRKNQTLERFHEFLKLENEIGNITRQEAVSMVPPLFLDVCPDHFILDMCAAPGSKTFQLLEIIYQSTKPGSLPNGMVIANDLDVQRCNLLIHQTKRMCTANLIVTNNEAQHFPGCRANKSCTKASEIEFEPPIGQLLFDRVLCDVPCSGDGTLRKAPDLWRKWNSGMGNGLHVLQIQIAMRGMSLLKVGGRMVYSTCSMNPVENEAVVAEILRKCGGSVELLNVSSELPQLVRRPGLRKWKVRDKGIWLSSHKDVSKFRRYGILPSMFPSGRSYVAPAESDHKHENGGNKISEDEPMEDPMASEDSNEEVSDLPLERCMRIVPHDQNSGAFFIAVFHKLSPLPVIPEKPSRRGNLNRKHEPEEKSSDQDTEGNNGVELKSEEAAAERFPEAASEADLIENELDSTALEPDSCNTCGENESGKAQALVNGETQSSNAVGKRKLQIQGKWKGVDPVLFFKDEAIINSIKAFYGIDESFPFNGHLISRNNDNNHVKRIYYVSKSVKDVLELNLLVGQQLKIASVGLKMFERQTSREGTSAPCSFRISSEGLPVILPHITKQILYASLVDFKHLLQYKSVKYTDFVDAEFGEKASKLLMGCCVIVLRDGKILSDPIQVDASTIAIGCWKGRSSLSVMVTAIDCQELLERLLARMDTGEGSSVQESIAEACEAQDDMNGIEKVEDTETTEQATVS